MKIPSVDFLPSGEHVLLHVRIRNLVSSLVEPSAYRDLALEIIQETSKRRPLSIVVPSFTYSFTKDSFFSIRDSPAEVGRFSEEIRGHCHPSQRVFDPIFSIIDVDNFGWKNLKNIKEAFGRESIWHKWDELNGIVVNIDLPSIISTQIHFIEYQAQVPYRYRKNFEGIGIDTDGNKHHLDYQYYVRDLKKNPIWNRLYIEEVLRKSGVLNEVSWNGVEVRWFRARDTRTALMPIIEKNPYALLQNHKNFFGVDS